MRINFAAALPLFTKFQPVSLVLLFLLVFPLSLSSLPKPTGELWVSGDVTVNGRSASSGMTVLSGNKIKTALNGVATIYLGQAGHLKLQANSELVINLTTGGVGGELRTGQLGVQTKPGIGIAFQTANGLVASSDKTAVVLGLGVTKDETTVSALRGSAKITLNNQVEAVSSGEEITIGTNAKARRRKLSKGITMGAGGGSAASLAALAAESFSSTLTKLGIPTSSSSAPLSNTVGESQTGPNPVPTPYSPTQSNPLPSATPVTPVKPPPTATVCNVCQFDTRDGRSTNPTQSITICHRQADGTTQTLTISCSALVGHFNLNGTPRAGHDGDLCLACTPR